MVKNLRLRSLHSILQNPGKTSVLAVLPSVIVFRRWIKQLYIHITYMFSNGCFDKMFTFLPNWYERFLPIHLQCIGPNPQWVQVLSNVAQRSQILNSISILKLTWKEKERNYPSEIIPTLLWCSHCYAISHYLFSTLLPSISKAQ